ncbi:MAG TPA: hypothetical protein DIT64_10810 [Verrucomicrobiales bacterium]|nr:hypothetical protein [Verrucomicrobiales bacterium]
MKLNPILTAILLASAVVPAIAKWSRLPSPVSRPTSISTVLNGTSVHDSSRIGQANHLILADPLKPVALNAGKSSATLKLSRQSVVHSVSFVSEGLEGRVELALSADGKAWSQQQTSGFTPLDRLVKLSAGAAQGRFLRLDFDLVRGGSLRSFQVIGTDTDANYTVKQNADGTGAPVNFAAGIGGGRLLYINPELYGARGDAARLGRLEFPESDEKYRTAVYDFGQVRTLNEFGSVHSPRPVRLSVFAFDELPEKEDWRGRLAFDPSVFDTAEPVATIEDRKGTGVVRAKPKSAVKARYIAMRWEPDFNPPGFTVDDISINGFGDVSYRNGDTEVDTTGDGEGVTESTVKDGEGTESFKTEDGGGEDGGSGPPMMSVAPGAISAQGAGIAGAPGEEEKAKGTDPDPPTPQ